jgi:carboxylate-amine ligase
LSQIEVGTSKCDTLKQAAEEIRQLRRCVADVAANHGLAPIAASTHPFSAWSEQKHTPKARYNVLARDMQAVARRLLICGMHVHVGLDDDALRIDLMGQAAYFLPHLLALSTSSPSASSPTVSPCSTSCRGSACRSPSTVSASTNATWRSWSRPA